VALCVAGASVAGYVLVAYNRLERYDDLHIDAAPPGEPENYLVVGSDSRAGGSAAEAAETGGRRSDTIMVVRIDPAAEEAQVLSLHRDLWVPIAGAGREDKINAAYAMGTPEQGRQRLIDTIRGYLGIDVHHYVEIDFQGFGRLVDAVGGVPLFFDAAVRDRRSGLFQEELGCVTLDGEEALRFVRSRRLDVMTPEGEWQRDLTADLGRVTRQQIFLREALDRTLAHVGSNPLRLRELVGIATDSVGVDAGVGLGDIQDLADRFRDFGSDGLRTYALPVDEAGAPRYEVHMRGSEAEPILNVFRGRPPDEVSPRSVRVEVQNGSGTSGQAANVVDALDLVGFDVAGPGNAAAPAARTEVRHAPQDAAAARLLARHLAVDAPLVPDPALAAGTVVLVTGPDFTTVHDQPRATTSSPSTTGQAGGTDEPAADPSAPDASTAVPPPPPPDPVGRAVGAPPPGTDCSA
jgi:LCP family protein required for cell wall assembly